MSTGAHVWNSRSRKPIVRSHGYGRERKFTVGKTNKLTSGDRSSRNGTSDFFIRFQNGDTRLLETHHLTRSFRHWATSLCPMRRDRRLDLASTSRAAFRLHSRVNIRLPSRHEITVGTRLLGIALRYSYSVTSGQCTQSCINVYGTWRLLLVESRSTHSFIFNKLERHERVLIIKFIDR